MAVMVGLMVLAWVLLTALLTSGHVADRDWAAAVLWALFPTVFVLGLSYAAFASDVVSQDVVTLGIAGGYFVLTAIHGLISFRRMRLSGR